MKIKKEVKFSFIKDEINYNDINDIKEIYCDSKSFFNKSMLVLSVLFSVGVCYSIGKIIYFDFINKSLNYNFTDIISILGIILLAMSPTIYFLYLQLY